LEDLPGTAEGTGGVEGFTQVVVEGHSGGLGGVGSRDIQPPNRWVTSVDDDRTEGDAHLVLELVGGVDDLIHRHLFGESHQRHLAPGGVGE
jgi:hypothetical protein